MDTTNLVHTVATQVVVGATAESAQVVAKLVNANNNYISLLMKYSLEYKS